MIDRAARELESPEVNMEEDQDFRGSCSHQLDDDSKKRMEQAIKVELSQKS